MEYSIKFSQQEIQTLLLALGELPLKTSLAIFGKITQSITEQDHVQTQQSKSE